MNPYTIIIDFTCETLALLLNCHFILKALQIGNNYYTLIGFISTVISFYFATLEEYYTGYIDHGFIKGVTDASIMILTLLIFRGNDSFAKIVDSD